VKHSDFHIPWTHEPHEDRLPPLGKVRTGHENVVKGEAQLVTMTTKQ